MQRKRAGRVKRNDIIMNIFLLRDDTQRKKEERIRKSIF